MSVSFKRRLKRMLIAFIDALLCLAFPWRCLRRRPSALRATRRILVCRTDHIGDAFLSLPALARIRAHYPEAHLTVLVASWAAPLLRAAGGHDELLICDPPWWVAKRNSRFGKSETEGGWFALWQTIRRLRARRFDLCVVLRGDVREIVAFGVFGGARFLLTRQRNGGAALADLAPAIDDALHECDQNLMLVGALGLAAFPATFPTPYTAADAARAEEWLSKRQNRPASRTVILHPGAKWVNRWPAEAYAELIRGLATQQGDVRILLTGSASEAALCERLAAELPGRTQSLAGKLSLTDTAALMAAVNLVVMADTGPMHFLNAVKTPALLLFGPTAASRFAPRGPHITVVSAGECCNAALHETCSRAAPGAPSACMAQLAPATVLRLACDKLGLPAPA